jgi:hypothetical protein
MLGIMIKIEHNGVVYLCDTVDEAARLGRTLQGEAQPGTIGHIEASADPAAVPWTPELYRRFIARLGPSQQQALAIMLEKKIVLAEYLCEKLNLSGGQALAGVLSGLSQQAVALGLSPRTVFEIETTRTPEGRRSIYTVDEDLAHAAQDYLLPNHLT